MKIYRVPSVNTWQIIIGWENWIFSLRGMIWASKTGLVRIAYGIVESRRLLFTFLFNEGTANTVTRHVNIWQRTWSIVTRPKVVSTLWFYQARVNNVKTTVVNEMD